MAKPTNPITGMKTGYGSRSKWKTLSTPYDKRKITKEFDYNNDKHSFPNGIIPAILIGLFYLLTLGLAIGLAIRYDQNNPGVNYFAQTWYNTQWFVSSIPLILMAFWGLGRAGFMQTSRYSMMKTARSIKLDKLRQWMMYKAPDFALNHVNSLSEFESYCKDRKVFTKKIFYISLGIYGGIFLISTIITAVFNVLHALGRY